MTLLLVFGWITCHPCLLSFFSGLRLRLGLGLELGLGLGLGFGLARASVSYNFFCPNISASPGSHVWRGSHSFFDLIAEIMLLSIGKMLSSEILVATKRS